jgi:hypothetical protein
MSGRRSRRKGAVGENEFRDVLRSFGFDARRTPMSGGAEWKGDLINAQGGSPIPFVHLEIKRQERLCIPAWIRQAEADAPDDHVPVVVFRQNGQPWRAIVPADHYLRLIASVEPATFFDATIDNGE